MTDVLRVDTVSPDPELIQRAATCLREGGLVAFPTETVYGLGVHALDREAVARLFAAKGRPANDPLIVHVTSVEAVRPLVTSIPDVVRDLAHRFWPGPLTVVLPRSKAVPLAVTAGLDTVAVRLPAHPVARALIERAGVPVAAPSANLFSRPSPTRAEHVLQDLEGRIDLIVDGGPTTVGVESTVLDLTSDIATVLRPGAVTLEQLRTILPNVRLRTTIAAGEPMRSPGLLSRHYSPRAELTLYTGNADAARERLLRDARALTSQGRRVGVIAASDDRHALSSLHAVELIELGAATAPEDVAARLYAAFRDMDSRHVEVILVRDFVIDEGLGAAVRDRLTRAAAGRIVHS